jgi:ABC-type bacteriocin/lantibiotic exporter with double-glycine peptidase domain
MKYYKDQDGNVYAYENAAEKTAFGPAGLTAMTAAQLEAHINPPKTAEQLESEQATAAAQAVTSAKLAGVEFEGVMCSATKEDMWGLAAIAPWVQAGNSAAFEFDNGNVLVITPENQLAFQQAWSTFRATFFPIPLQDATP